MLHTRASLAAAVQDIAAGKREPRSDLERYGLLRGYIRGELQPSCQYDAKAAVADGVDIALHIQALAQAPAAVRSNPALLKFWLDRAATLRHAAPPIAAKPYFGLLESIGALPPRNAPSIHQAARALEHRILEITNPQLVAHDARTGQQTVLADGVWESAVEAAWTSGKLGLLGKFLCAFSAYDQRKLRAVDAALDLQHVFPRLASVSTPREPGAPPQHALLQSPNNRDLVHPQVVGDNVHLAWLCHTPSDAPPAELPGSWSWTELASRPGHGVYFLERPTAEPAAIEEAAQ